MFQTQYPKSVVPLAMFFSTNQNNRIWANTWNMGAWNNRIWALSSLSLSHSPLSPLTMHCTESAVHRNPHFKLPTVQLNFRSYLFNFFLSNFKLPTAQLSFKSNLIKCSSKLNLNLNLNSKLRIVQFN